MRGGGGGIIIIIIIIIIISSSSSNNNNNYYYEEMRTASKDNFFSDLKLSGPPSGQGADSGYRIRIRRIHADLRTGSLSTVPPMPLFWHNMKKQSAIVIRKYRVFRIFS
ncbi:hypothetical protein PoB_001842200 [Plakobranchus ocellatus]|uniref:Uncharacterized protein n=1 Tax=Plakobranchus ocellatus TaxID=259542 RepID=A0AAV3ZBR3_9GAST|nr:hypothetical protein PoB_001842200 [Plakobranchus ocellatus]